MNSFSLEVQLDRTRPDMDGGARHYAPPLSVRPLTLVAGMFCDFATFGKAETAVKNADSAGADRKRRPAAYL